MDLQTLKNTYAQEQGYVDWGSLCRESMSLIYDMEYYMNEICIRAQKEALENAAENAVTTTEEHYVAGHIGLTVDIVVIDRTSITNPENLIR